MHTVFIHNFTMKVAKVPCRFVHDNLKWAGQEISSVRLPARTNMAAPMDKHELLQITTKLANIDEIKVGIAWVVV